MPSNQQNTTRPLPPRGRARRLHLSTAAPTLTDWIGGFSVVALPWLLLFIAYGFGE